MRTSFAAMYTERTQWNDERRRLQDKVGALERTLTMIGKFRDERDQQQHRLSIRLSIASAAFGASVGVLLTRILLS